MSRSPVAIERRGRVGVLTICRPEVRNAVNGPVAVALEAALDDLEADQNIWAMVLTGEGSVFCSGADLRMIADRDAPAETERGGFAGITTRDRHKPLVAAVEGAALAGGFEIALACDLIVAAEGAVFGLPEVRRGLVAGAGGLVRLPASIPPKLAMEMAVLGAPVTAARLHALGLVNRLVASGHALAEARALAEEIAANPPIAVMESRAVVAAVAASEAEAWKRNEQAQERVQQTQDYLEGPRAFLERRDPEWTGR